MVKKTLFLLGFLLLSVNVNASETADIYLPQLKSLIFQKCLAEADQKQTSFEIIQEIAKDAVDYARGKEASKKLKKFAAELKTELEYEAVFMTEEEIIKTLIPAINS